MSDWEIVKEYILDKKYKPQDTDLNGLITVILLSWESQNEQDEEQWGLKTYLKEVVGNDFQSYDYE